MSFPGGKSGIDEYKKVNATSGMDEFKPHRLIQMLMEGALEKISTARGMMERDEVAGKGELIGKAISIVEGLRVSLDKSAGGDIADNLDMLYEYMAHRLLEANLHNKPDYLSEVSEMLSKIKDAWDQIPQEIIDEHAEKVKGRS